MKTFLPIGVMSGKARAWRLLLLVALPLIPLLVIGRQREYSRGEDLSGLPRAMTFSPASQLAVSETTYQPSTYGTQQRLHFDVLERDQTLDVPGAFGTLQSLQFSPDGKTLLASSNVGMARVSVPDLQVSAVVPARYTADEIIGFSWREAAAFSAIIVKGKRQIGEDITFFVENYRASDGKLLGARTLFTRHQTNSMLADCVASPDARVLAVVWNGVAASKNGTSIGKDGFIELWDADSGTMRCRLEDVKPMALGKLAFSRDAKLVAAADQAGRGFIWETGSGALLQMISGLRSPDDKDGVTMAFSSAAGGGVFARDTPLAFSPDGSALFAGLRDGRIVRFDVKSGLPSALLTRVGGFITDLQCAPNGSVLAIASRRVNENFGTLTRVRLSTR